MKLKELNGTIATACNVRPNVVSSIHAETFKQLRAALDRGEKVVIPEFGQFVVRDLPAVGESPAKKIIKFRARSGEAQAKKEGEAKPKKGGAGRAKKEGKEKGASEAQDTAGGKPEAAAAEGGEE